MVMVVCAEEWSGQQMIDVLISSNKINLLLLKYTFASGALYGCVSLTQIGRWRSLSSPFGLFRNFLGCFFRVFRSTLHSCILEVFIAHYPP
jgi:hypothetical protein